MKDTMLNKIRLSPNDGAQVYATLRKQVTSAGILDRDYRYYGFMMLFVFSGFFLSLYAIIKTDSLLYLIGYSIIFGFFGTHVTGFIHDAGHRAVFQSVRSNDILGIISSSFLSMGFHNWRVRHNVHHAHPNEVGEDPDIEIPLLSFTQERYLSKKGLTRKLQRYQVFFYYPLLFMINFTLRLNAIEYFRKNTTKKTLWQLIVYVAGLFAWFVLPFFVFDLPKAALFFLVSNLTMGIYLMQVIAPNHKPMPQVKKGLKLSFMEQQILTTMNVKGSWFNDFFYMGLNYQIEHHLFPNCPRNKLKYIQPYVLAICKKMKADYTEVGAIQSNKMILQQLIDISRSSKKILEATAPKKKTNAKINYAAYIFRILRSSSVQYLLLFIGWFTGRK